MQTHHLSLGARGQRYMWATVTCLKVTAPDRSNLYHPRRRAWWMRLSSFYQCPCPRSRIDGRGAAWRAVPTSCLPGSQTCIREITRSSKQTRLTEKLSICWNLKSIDFLFLFLFYVKILGFCATGLICTWLYSTALSLIDHKVSWGNAHTCNSNGRCGGFSQAGLRAHSCQSLKWCAACLITMCCMTAIHKVR